MSLEARDHDHLYGRTDAARLHGVGLGRLAVRARRRRRVNRPRRAAGARASAGGGHQRDIGGHRRDERPRGDGPDPGRCRVRHLRGGAQGQRRRRGHRERGDRGRRGDRRRRVAALRRADGPGGRLVQHRRRGHDRLDIRHMAARPGGRSDRGAAAAPGTRAGGGGVRRVRIEHGDGSGDSGAGHRLHAGRRVWRIRPDAPRHPRPGEVRVLQH